MRFEKRKTFMVEYYYALSKHSISTKDTMSIAADTIEDAIDCSKNYASFNGYKIFEVVKVEESHSVLIAQKSQNNG